MNSKSRWQYVVSYPVYYIYIYIYVVIKAYITQAACTELCDIREKKNCIYTAIVIKIMGENNCRIGRSFHLVPVDKKIIVVSRESNFFPPLFRSMLCKYSGGFHKN